ncbi:MAG: hypothetical protein AAF648_14140 [Pseudomonadota bacterium]
MNRTHKPRRTHKPHGAQETHDGFIDRQAKRPGALGSRRNLLLSLGQSAAFTALGGLLPTAAAAEAADASVAPRSAPQLKGPSLADALSISNLIYLTPIRSDGTESRCQAEIWFQEDSGRAVVCTKSDAWRARAILNGLTETQIWVGDVGVWTRSRGAYRKLPGGRATGSVLTGAAAQERVLKKLAAKYRREWGVWGPRFKRGLNDGTRIMLSYEFG